MINYKYKAYEGDLLLGVFDSEHEARTALKLAARKLGYRGRWFRYRIILSVG